MKKFNVVLGSLITLFFLSCTGTQGPPGFNGRDGANGADGVTILGQVLDIEGSFTFENNFAILYEFPQTVEVFESD
ncbi:MAG: hypothetical protein ACI9SG_002056, partial [Maribacter sp.]